MRLTWVPDAPAPAVPAALAAALGAGSGLALPLPPPVPLVAALALAGAAGAALGVARGGRWRLVGCLVLVLTAAAWQARRAVLDPLRADAALVASLRESAVSEVTGRLATPWTASGSLRRAEIDVETATALGREIALRGPVQLVVGGSADPDGTAGLGERVRVRGELRLPDVTPDPRSPFDLPPAPRLSQKSAVQVERLGGPSGLLSPLRSARRATLLRLKRNLASAQPREKTALALLLALVIGETADIPSRAVTAFRDGGAAHVLAVSGLQVVFLAALLHRLLPSRLVSLRGRDAVVLLATFSYAALAGGSPPVVRAALTIGLYLASRLLGRPVSVWQALGGSATVLLLADPGNLLDAGFLLTYAAAAGIGVFGAPLARALVRVRVPSAAASAVGATAGAELAVLPVQAYSFQVVPLVGLVSNLLVVPLSLVFLLCGLALLPALLASPAAAALAIRPLALLSDGLLLSLDLFDRLGALRFVPAPSWLAALTLALLLALAAAPGSRRRRAVALAAGLGLGAFLVFRPGRAVAEGTSELRPIDVGQGDAWLARSAGGALLVDGGGSYDPEYDFGRLRLLPRLSALGAVRLDAVALTHPHPDHGRGLVSVLRVVPVGELALPRGAERNELLDELLDAAARRGVPIRRYGTGETLAVSGVPFAVLHPSGAPYPRGRENNGSLVLRVRLGGRHVLLTGDVEALAERDLVASGLPLSADVLKVPHHGSRTSTSPELLERVAPRLAVLSAGRRNRFGHPAASVVSRLDGAGARLLRTDRDGEFALRFEAGRISPLFAESLPRTRW